MSLLIIRNRAFAMSWGRNFSERKEKFELICMPTEVRDTVEFHLVLLRIIQTFAKLCYIYQFF